MTGIISAIVIVAALIAGFGIKFFFGEIPGEAAESLIEKVVEVESGIDINPLFKLDDKK